MLVSNFLNNGPKTCLYELKSLENIQIEHAFQFKAFFRMTSNLHASCFSAFNLNQISNYFWCVRYTKVQWNLFKVDILFSEELSTTDNFLQNRWNYVQTFTAKSLCSGHPSIIYSRHHFSLCLHPRQPCTFFKSYMRGSFFAAFCHVLLHFVCTAEIIM